LNLAGQPLEAVLRSWQPGRDRAEIRSLLRGHRVLVDGNLAAHGGLRLKAGQVIKLLRRPRAEAATERDVLIRYYDADVVVVEKPAGMTSIRHPDEHQRAAKRRQHQPTLTELLPRLLARVESARGSRSTRRPLRAVHRLDRDTSGLMVFARNVKAQSHLGRQFREHTIRRVYFAIVEGKIEEQRIDANLLRDDGSGRRGSTSRSDVGKRAVTHVTPLEQLAGFTLVKCRLETGRTHQIRIHLADRGHPVCGDNIYGRRGKRRRDADDLPRLALHAGALGFRHPKDERLLDFESPLPDELRQFLLRLRGKLKPGGRDAL
jgi:23S rRNA pseudouridine1911/1915/1917 synthase